jgi:hypothetical protein
LETSIEYATDEKPWFISVIHGARQEEILFLGVLPEDAQRGVLFRFDGSVATVFPAGYYARAVSGDVNGDGRLEVVISSKQDGPRIFDLGGNEMGRIRLPYMTSHFYLVDIDGDKAEEIIAQTAEDRGRRIRIVKGNGTNVGAWSLLFRFYDFAVARWPGENDLRLLFLNGDTVAVLDCEGKQCMSLNAPRGSRTVRISACTVVGGEDGLKLVCVTSGRVGGPHIVFVWSQDGELEYRQMAVDSADSVMEIPEPGGRSVGGFLVGSEGKIWKYAPRGSQ